MTETLTQTMRIPKHYPVEHLSEMRTRVAYEMGRRLMDYIMPYKDVGVCVFLREDEPTHDPEYYEYALSCDVSIVEHKSVHIVVPDYELMNWHKLSATATSEMIWRVKRGLNRLFKPLREVLHPPKEE